MIIFIQIIYQADKNHKNMFATPSFATPYQKTDQLCPFGQTAPMGREKPNSWQDAENETEPNKGIKNVKNLYMYISSINKPKELKTNYVKAANFTMPSKFIFSGWVCWVSASEQNVSSILESIIGTQSMENINDILICKDYLTNI